jgi:hypothetical protein
MIRHIAVFEWVDGTSPEQVAAVTEALLALPAQVPTIRSYVAGPDLELGADRWDYAVVGEFDDVDGFRTYADDPTHRATIATHITPILARRASLQIEV